MSVSKRILHLLVSFQALPPDAAEKTNNWPIGRGDASTPTPLTTMSFQFPRATKQKSDASMASNDSVPWEPPEGFVFDYEELEEDDRLDDAMATDLTWTWRAGQHNCQQLESRLQMLLRGSRRTMTERQLLRFSGFNGAQETRKSKQQSQRQRRQSPRRRRAVSTPADARLDALLTKHAALQVL